MICKKCGKDVVLEGIECPQCGYSHIVEDVVIPPKIKAIKKRGKK